jgi:hypothetical protein
VDVLINQKISSTKYRKLNLSSENSLLQESFPKHTISQEPTSKQSREAEAIIKKMEAK